MAVAKVATPVASGSNLVAIDLCALLDQAYRGEGHTAQIAAAMLGMSPQSYSKAIGPQYVDNPVMKRLGLPENRRVLRKFLSMAAAESELAVGIDSETVTAAVEFANAHVRLLKVVGE